MVQKLNALVHREPYQNVLHHLYWTTVLMVVMPVVGLTSLILGLVEFLRQMVSFLVWGEFRRTIDPKQLLDREGVELAVLITGCDSGIGHELALRLARQGFTVFAGCYRNPKETKLFANDVSSPMIHPLWMDVTNQEHVDRSYQAVADWVAFRDADGGDPVNREGQRRRHFYALLNNAGVARFGYVDWCRLSDYQLCLEVNCLAHIRTCKAFLPLFQQQAKQRSAGRANTRASFHAMRIININSMAGQIPSGVFCLTPYEVSKNAAASFTDGLRLELKPWGIDVISVDPSFHETPMADTSAMCTRMRNDVWDRLPRDKQDNYGTRFLETYIDHLSRSVNDTLWELDGLFETIVDRCILSATAPPAQVSIGLDAKFVIWLLRLLPPAWRNRFFRTVIPEQRPAGLLPTGTSEESRPMKTNTEKSKTM